MKKAKTVRIVSALCIAALCVLLFASWRGAHQIDPVRVEKIVISFNQAEGYELTAAESAAFIKSYNTSAYAGEGTGEGGTPEFGITVHFRDGSILRVNDFSAMGRNFEVSLRDAAGDKKAWYYVNSEELYAFVQAE